MSSVSVLRLLSQFLVIPILSRLLSPTDYGLMAIAMPFVLFTMVFADAGVGRSIIRTPASQKDEWSTCFWLSVLLGLVLGIIMIVLGPIASAIFGEKDLSPIIMSLSLVIFAQSISTVPGAALQQHHRFKTIAAIELTSLFSGIAAAVGIALAGGGAWALAGQQIVLYLVRCALSFWYTPFKPIRVFELKIVRDHLIFGRDVIGVALVQLTIRSLDGLIIGKALGSAMLGFYSMAFQFARLPVMLVTGPLQYVMYAQLAQIRNNVAGIGHIFLLMSRIIASVVFPVVGMVAVAHQPIFTWLLSEKWAFSGEIYMIVAASCSLQAITGIGNIVMMALGRTDRQFRITAEFASLWLVSLFFMVSYGITISALTYSVVVILYAPRLLSLLLPLINCSFASYFRALRVAIATALSCAGVYLALNYEWEIAQWAQITIAAVLAFTGIVIGLLLQRRLLLSEIALCRQALNT